MDIMLKTRRALRHLGLVLLLGAAFFALGPGCQAYDVAAASCRGDDDGGQCTSDDECRNGQVCLLDLKRRAATQEPCFLSYCTTACNDRRDCPPYQDCVAGRLDGVDSRYCVDLVRSCEDDDPFDGLDNDCDGMVDEGGGPMTTITGCLDGFPCGAFVCQAPEDQPETVCAPPVPGASVPDFAPCTSGSECQNGLCVAGFCSPLCRPSTAPCPAGFDCDCPRSLVVDGVERVTVCARSVVPGGDRPDHNVCLLAGRVGGLEEGCAWSSCPSGTECVWRDVVGQELRAFRQRFFVCSQVDPGAKPLGAACTDNTLSGDLECQHGLCFGNVCTRRCSGPGDACGDVASGFVCVERALTYEGLPFPRFICDRSGP